MHLKVVKIRRKIDQKETKTLRCLIRMQYNFSIKFSIALHASLGLFSKFETIYLRNKNLYFDERGKK